ncbi:MAG: hypothetical protein HC890_15905 [Chloroflexaceae bacterium]|nr:hypothetical protein [Chloroflexaceae bacterium]
MQRPLGYSLTLPLFIDSESAEDPGLSLDLAATSELAGLSIPSLNNLSPVSVEEFTRAPDNERTTVALADLLGSFNSLQLNGSEGAGSATNIEILPQVDLSDIYVNVYQFEASPPSVSRRQRLAAPGLVSPGLRAGSSRRDQPDFIGQSTEAFGPSRVLIIGGDRSFCWPPKEISAVTSTS